MGRSEGERGVGLGPPVHRAGHRRLPSGSVSALRRGRARHVLPGPDVGGAVRCPTLNAEQGVPALDRGHGRVAADGGSRAFPGPGVARPSGTTAGRVVLRRDIEDGGADRGSTAGSWTSRGPVARTASRSRWAATSPRWAGIDKAGNHGRSNPVRVFVSGDRLVWHDETRHHGRRG